jgi:hypothetical protein
LVKSIVGVLAKPATEKGLSMRDRRATESVHPGPRLLQPRTCRLTLAFAAMLFVGLISQPPTALGDIIIFHDLTETVTVEHIGSADTATTASCLEDIGCPVGLTRAGATVVSATFGPIVISPRSLLLGGKIGIAEDATLQFVSDEFIAVSQSDFSAFVLNFDSLADGTQISCTDPSLTFGCTVVETGAVQTLGTIHWSSGDDDTIQFESDVEVAAAVPEPASALLLATACAILLPYTRRRRHRAA